MKNEKRLDLIDRNALLNKAIKVSAKREGLNLGCYQWNDEVYAVTVSNIYAAPTVDAVEVVHGRWIEVESTITGVYRCSICGKSAVMKHNYCNRCGAKMDL